MSEVHRPILSRSSSNERSKLPQLSSKSKLITTVGWVTYSPVLVVPLEWASCELHFLRSVEHGWNSHASLPLNGGMRLSIEPDLNRRSTLQLLVGHPFADGTPLRRPSYPL